MSEWISVEERLPENNVCIDAWGTINAGYHSGDSGRYENVFFDHEKKKFWKWLEKLNYNDEEDAELEYVKRYFGVDLIISHWMPLPPPPEDGK